MDRIWYKESKLILGIDIGTTYSGATFVLLQQGCKPVKKRVTKWPGQDQGNQSQCSIPSLIWYTEYKKPALFGAEAFHVQVGDEQPGWQLAKHFKLRLHPTDMVPPKGFKLHPLPTGVDISQIYTDFLRYLFGHARSYFQQSQLDGLTVWNSLSRSMKIVIAHPNGWGVREQGFLRRVAIKSGLSEEVESHSRISFVTEAEASLHFCLNLEPPPSFGVGMNLIVCDAGGSTVDITAYRVTAITPKLELEEIKPSACVQAGSIFVDDEATRYITDQIESGGVNGQVDTDAVCARFIAQNKPHFTGKEGDVSLKVGKRELQCPSINIQRGHMKIPGTTVKLFFDTCVKEILKTIRAQAQGVASPYYCLVGGFGDSRYLQNELVAQHGISGRLTTSNDPGAKAVADGAAMWEVAITVSSRTTRYAYGTNVCIPRNNQDQEHLSRPVVKRPARDYTGGAWSEIIPQGKSMPYNECISHSYNLQFSSPSPQLSAFETDIYCTKLPASTTFMKDRQGNVCRDFTTVCTVSADLQHMCGYLTEKRNDTGTMYWKLDFDICIQFGGTELNAFIRWVHKGTTKTGPAKVIAQALA